MSDKHTDALDLDKLEALATKSDPIYTDLYGDRYSQGSWSRVDLEKEQDDFITAFTPTVALQLIAKIRATEGQAQTSAATWETGLPEVPVGDYREFIVACKRANGKTYVFSAYYLNGKGLLSRWGDDPDEPEDGTPVTGWFFENEVDGDNVFEPVCPEGDEITHWQAMPSAPAAQLADSTAPGAPESHPDDLAVQAFADAMKAKMAKSRAKGRGGWQECHAEDLRTMMMEHIAKGDPVDVANFAMMLWNLNESTFAKQPVTGGVDWRGLALELESRSKTVESKTTYRAMQKAAHGLRLMGAAPTAQQSLTAGGAVQNLELVIARLEQIAGNFTDDYRNAAEEALVCARAALKAQPVPTEAQGESPFKFRPWSKEAGMMEGWTAAEAQRDELHAAATAVVARWDTPMWKHETHTGELVDRLRKALATNQTAATYQPGAAQGEDSARLDAQPIWEYYGCSEAEWIEFKAWSKNRARASDEAGGVKS